MEDTARAQMAAEVRAAVARAGVRRGELAERTGLSRHTLGRKLDGKSPFSLEEIKRIANAIGAAPGDLAAAVYASTAQ